jgi:glutamate formiminotransferase
VETLVECVPNLSVANDIATLDAVSAVISQHGGTWLLDRTSDVDHARSVFTLAGYPGPVMTAMEAAVGVAIERIDMRSQRGQHPRIGAVDVIPFIPLGDTTMEQCVQGAREFAARIAARFELPVYLYGRAAQHPGRNLADLRRPGFEGLDAAMRGPGHTPDLGPSSPHPTAGATAVGVRPFLIAFNIQLSTTDVSVARRIAGRIRERDGGLPAVQALGLELRSQGCTQLSMNLLDHQRMPLWTVWEAAERLAAAEHISLLDSELIGLAPMGSLLAVADHIGVPAFHPPERRSAEAAAWLRIRRFEPEMVLERRLHSVRAMPSAGPAAPSGD